MKEEWRVMSSGIHEVSNLGRVRRANRPDARIMKPTPASSGYPTFKSIDASGARRTFCVHRVVAELFIGPPGGMHVNHKNGVKDDNRLVNLEYVTPAQNAAHAAEHGLMATAERHGSKTHPGSVRSGERHGAAKLTRKNVDAIREAVRAGATRLATAAMFGVNEATVRHILAGDTWRRHGFTPETFPSQRYRRGAANGNAKLTDEQAAAIRSAYAAQLATQTQLAREYGVSQATINNVVLGKAYV